MHESTRSAARGERLTFSNANMAALLSKAEAAWPQEIQPLYGEVTGPGFWLVGDEGVYLMHNGKGVDGKQPVAYAIECDPTALPFDDWWEAKRRTFGGDDGVEFIEADIIRAMVAKGESLEIEFADGSMSLIAVK